MGKRFHEELFSDQKDQVKNALLFTVNRQIVVLYKRFFNLMEDLKLDHKIMMGKLEKELGKEEVEKLDYFDEDKYNYLRKKILDLGNESIREIGNFSTMLEVQFKERGEKVKNEEKEETKEE